MIEIHQRFELEVRKNSNNFQKYQKKCSFQIYINKYIYISEIDNNNSINDNNNKNYNNKPTHNLKISSM